MTTSSSSACPLCRQARTERIFERAAYGSNWGLAHCLNCGLHFTDPVPTMEQIRGFYQGEYHTELFQPGETEQHFQPKYRRYIQFIQSHLPAGGATLDIGCATGLFPKLLRDLGFQAEGVELNAAAAKWGREHFRIPIFEGTLDDLLATGRKFDLISMTDVLEHTMHPPEEVRKVGSMLNPGGHFLVTFPDILSLSSRYLRKLSQAAKREWIWSTCHIPLHTWEFTYPTALRLFTENGFRLVGFQRSEGFRWEASLAGFLSLPSNVAALPGLRRWTGNQMEFLLRKV